MEVYIKDMEMPTSCGFCVFEQETGDGCECYVNGCLTEYQKRPSDCPLVPVPPHGRLIDVDGKTFPTPHRNPSNDYMKGWNACLKSAKQQPTVIPTETGEE